MRKEAPRLFVGTVFLLAACCLVQAAAIHVPDDYSTIQGAIDAARGGYTVIIAQDTYTENINFKGKAITVRSSDPTDPDVVANTTIDGGANGCVVRFVTGETRESVLKGLTITNGKADTGAGILCDGANPTIVGNVICHNEATSNGGGIGCINGASPLIEENTIWSNEAYYGGGAYCRTASNAVFNGGVVDGNQGYDMGGGLYLKGVEVDIAEMHIANNISSEGGGGISLDDGGLQVTHTALVDNETDGAGGGIGISDSTCTIEDTVFQDNRAPYRHWAESSSGGGIAVSSSVCRVERCEFRSNSAAERGGGISATSTALSIHRSRFSHNEAGFSGGALAVNGGAYQGEERLIAFCLFDGNHAEGNGGAIDIEGHGQPVPEIVNCTLVGNSAPADSAGGIKGTTSDISPVITNCIIASQNSGAGILQPDDDVLPAVSYCNVYDNPGGDYVGMPDQTGDNGNIKVDPCFADPLNHDYHLKSRVGRWDPDSQSWVTDLINSPCIDAGDPFSDFSQEPQPPGAAINMGAYGNTAEASKAPAVDGTRTCHALLVGISDYAGTQSDLNYCDDDALDMAAVLEAGENWDAANIDVLLDREATAANIHAGLQSMAERADGDDMCVFFFSGHGTRGDDLPPLDEDGGSDEYLCETDLENNIRDDQLADWVAELPTSHVMVVLCACYSGGHIKGPGSTAKGLGRADPPGTAANDFANDLRAAMAKKQQISPRDLDDNGYGVVLTACNDNETCIESSALENDLFGYHVIEGLKGLADSNNDSRVTAEEAFGYAEPLTVAENSGQHPQLYDADSLTSFPCVDYVHAITITDGPNGVPGQVASGENVACSVEAECSLGHDLVYQWTAEDNNGAPAGSFGDAASQNPTWTAPANDTDQLRKYTISVTIHCAENGVISVSDSFVQRVKPGLRANMFYGWNMLSMGQPADPSATVSDLLGSDVLRLYRWNAAQLRYEEIDPATTCARDLEAVGTWEYCGETEERLIGVREPEDVTVDVVAGWNLLANPFPYAIDLEDALEPQGTVEVMLPAYRWNWEDYAYDQLTVAPAGSSFWLLSPCNGQLTFAVVPPAPPPAEVASLASALDRGQDATCIQLAAEAGGSRDTSTWIGTTSGEAVRTPKPPMAPNAVGAYLDVADGIGHARAIVPESAEQTWTLTVNSPAEEETSLRIVDTSELPGDMALWLTDRASGERIDLRHAPSYSYTAREGQREFSIEIGKRDDLLQVMGVSAQSAGHGAEISFTLSAAGSATVDVLNIAGRTVKRIVTDRECEAGPQTVSWNGVSDRGTRVPGGMYLVRVTAAAPAGEQCQGLATMRMR